MHGATEKLPNPDTINRKTLEEFVFMHRIFRGRFYSLLCKGETSCYSLRLLDLAEDRGALEQGGELQYLIQSR